MSFSKAGLLGPIFGGTMLAFIGSSDAEAAPKCDDLDLSRADNIIQTITDCLNGVSQPAASTGPILNEIEIGGCVQERNRSAGTLETVCRFYIPADTRCPDGIDKESRIGNRFDTDLTVDGRTVGTRACTVKNLIPPKPNR